MNAEVQAVSAGTMSTVNLGGTDQYGQRYGIHLMDPMMSGFGAYSGCDGYDLGGSYSTTIPNVANVESNEFLSPMLYLHRRIEPDTGGAGTCVANGRQHGITAHGVAKTEALIMTHGLEVPNSMGILGGYPGSCVKQRLMRASDLAQRQRAGRSPVEVSELEGELEEMGPKPGLIELRPGDVFETSWQGGGGLGDPLDRNPASVAADCHAGHRHDAVCRADFKSSFRLAVSLLPMRPMLRDRLRREWAGRRRANPDFFIPQCRWPGESLRGCACALPWRAPVVCSVAGRPERGGNWRGHVPVRFRRMPGFHIRPPRAELRQFFVRAAAVTSVEAAKKACSTFRISSC
jgi:hypothetical protein